MIQNSGRNDKPPEFDRISELPEPIVHHIFAHLRCLKDVVRTRIWSKRWKRMFDSYMTFDFDDRCFGARGEERIHNRLRSREVQIRKFKSYVEKSIATKLAPAPCIDKFRLYVSSLHPTLVSSIENWIHLAVEKNVKVLEIHVNPKEASYDLPCDVLASKTITSLKLSGSLTYNLSSLELCNLRELSFKSVAVGELLIEKVGQNCPLLEDLRLVDCKGLLALPIPSLAKLRRIEVHECLSLKLIEIMAPNLETFWYHAKKHQYCIIDFKVCGTLKNLTLRDCTMTDTIFQSYMTECPLIENLVLQECSRVKKLTILSSNLKSLALSKCTKMQEVNIDAPNLYSFQFSGHRMPFYSMNVSGVCEIKFSFGHAVKTPQIIDECKKILGNISRSKGFKLVAHTKQIMKIYEDLKEVDLVVNSFSKLDLTLSKSTVVKLVDKWLCESHGRSLILISPGSDLVKEVDKDRTSEKKSIVVGLWGGNGGTDWDDGSYNGVREITVFYGRCIDSITVLYDKNGKPVSADKHGGSGGNNSAEFPEEFLTSVSGHYCPVVRGGSHVIRSLTFKSNRRTYGPFGVEEGTSFSLPMEGGQIVGFKGRSGWYVDAIGFHISRTKTTKITNKVQQRLRRLVSTVSLAGPRGGQETKSKSLV